MTWYDDTPDTPEYLDGAGSNEERWPADGLDRLIAESAREYNAPPPTVPRDAMWEAIMAARAPHAATRTPTPTPVVALADRRAERVARRRGLLAVAAAAAIFLATGIGIGRWWGPGDRVARTNEGAPRVAATTSASASTPATTQGDSSAAADSAAPVAPDTPRSTQLAAATSPRSAGRTGSGRGTLRAPASTTDAYDLVVLRHFAQAEALLVSYRADTVDAAMDARLAAWARPLLGDTRLLLDSPAASDPRRRRLLEDLELVLAELARLAPPTVATGATGAAGTVAATDSTTSSATARSRTERQLIDGTLRRAQLLPRLRTLVPAGT